MTSKERVYAALSRRPVDRVPIFMWFHPDTACRLGQLLDIPPRCVAEVMGDDVRQAWVGNNYAMEGIVHERDGQAHVDAWGIEWVKDGPFNQIRRSPLKDAAEEEILRFRYPCDQIDNLLRNMDPVVSQREEFFIGCDVSPCAFEMFSRVRGMENALMDLAASPGIAMKMLEAAAEFSLRLAEAACERFRPDWLWTGDDVGGQQGMLMSPSCWREMIRPYLERIFKAGAARGFYVAFHSCGAIRPIIPDLVEMGLDVLNPIQCNCPGMDPVKLKREFGDRLAFMGGVDTQGLLPNGDAMQVRRETERLVERMTAGGGGYILAASHTVPPETSIENIFAMYEAAGVSPEQIYDHAADMRRRSQSG